jgi:hypothetical protein
MVTGTDYQTYFNGAHFVHFLLGPATVAFRVPIYANLAPVRAQLLADGDLACGRAPLRSRAVICRIIGRRCQR